MNKNILDGLPVEKLTPEQETGLVKSKDYESLIMHSLREAVLYAGHCARGKIEPGELLSLCYSALSKSAPRFRPGGITFLAYSKPDLRGEISRYWKSINVVKNSHNHHTSYRGGVSHRYEDRTGRDEHVNPTNPNFYGGQHREEEDFDFCWEEVNNPIEEDFVDPEFDAIALRERWALVKPIIDSCLNERERTVLYLAYESGFTFEKIASMMVPKVVREAIRMTHERALRKIRNALLRSKKLYS